MTRYELLINNIKVDLGKTDISLNYKSNLLTDISKIVSNNSYTIKLPKTAKNLSLIECSHIPSAVSRFPYLKHTGTVLKDGIEIVKDAKIVLLSVGENIEIALTWGNVTNFASVVNDGKKLTDLQYGTVEGTDWVVWENWGDGSTRFPRIDYGINSGDPNVWRHPVEFVWWILEKIKEDNKITFKFPADKEEIIHKMIVPLLTRNDSEKIYDKYPIKFTGNVINYDKSYNGERGLNLILNIDSSLSKYGVSANITGTNITGIGYKVAYDLKASLKGIVVVSTSTPGINREKALLCVRLEDVEHNTIAFIQPKSFSSGNKLHITYDISLKDFEINKGQILCLSFLPDSKPDMLMTGDYVNIDLSLMISSRGEVLFGEKFPIVPNLPDIKQIDFIKAIASMVGLFALPNGDSGIKFISFDGLNANKSKAKDWTNKVIKAYQSVTPRSMKYTLDNIAQNNWFRYKEDNKASGNYDGNIQVEDYTIDYERDAVKLPFSACDTRNGVAYIPLYSYNDKGELQYNKTNPRILLLDKDNNGVFKGLEWRTLIENNYQVYSEMVNNAKVVTEYVRLNSIELRDLDMDVPVYLGQYGCYFAIIEIKTKNNDVCECKLLKMS